MIEYYKQKHIFDTHFNQYIQNLTNDMYVKNILFDAIQSGKRIRPIIIMEMTQFILQKPIENLNLAIAIELIHNASLILDDMPMMDNDTFRRGKHTLHYKYNEKIALFVADLFLNESAILIGKYLQTYITDKSNLTNIYSIFKDNLGIDGIIGGQLLLKILNHLPFYKCLMKKKRLLYLIFALLHHLLYTIITILLLFPRLN